LRAHLNTLHRAKPKSNLVYLQRLKRLAVFVGKPFEEMTGQDLDKFLNSITTDNQYNNYVQTIKRLFGWLGKGDIVNDLRQRSVDFTIAPSELLTTEEVVELASKTRSLMYKALILALFESSARVSEILQLKIGDVKFSSVRDKEDRRHVIVTLYFKTSKGRIAKPPVTLSMFALELKQWIENHPHKDNTDAYIFYSAKFNPDADKQITGDMVRWILLKARGLTSIKKRVNPHFLRHSGLSFLANTLNYNEQLLMWRAGWKSTQMAKRYVHSGSQIQNGEYLKRQGYILEEQPKVELIKPKPCPHCTQLNPYTNRNCDFCGMPLDITEYQKEMELRRKAFATKLSPLEIKEVDKHVALMQKLSPEHAKIYLEKLAETWLKVNKVKQNS